MAPYFQSILENFTTILKPLKLFNRLLFNELAHDLSRGLLGQKINKKPFQWFLEIILP